MKPAHHYVYRYTYCKVRHGSIFGLAATERQRAVESKGKYRLKRGKLSKRQPRKGKPLREKRAKNDRSHRASRNIYRAKNKESHYNINHQGTSATVFL